jgi:hypothetical protein
MSNPRMLSLKGYMLWALVTCCVTAFGPNPTSAKYHFFRLPIPTLTLSSPLSSPLSSVPSSPGPAHHIIHT